MITVLRTCFVGFLCDFVYITRVLPSSFFHLRNEKNITSLPLSKLERHKNILTYTLKPSSCLSLPFSYYMLLLSFI